MAADYTYLITSQHADKPNFKATIALLSSAFGQVYDTTLAITEAFSVDAAVGAQLDAVGLWVGIGRKQTVPVPSAFFTFDDADLGWDLATWKAPYEATEGITILDDDTYRAVIKAKIGSNYWDGTNAGQLAIGESAFNDLGVQCFSLDNMDMSVTVYIIGAPPQVLIEMIKRGVAPPKTAGVRVAGYILSSAPGAPLFALSVPTTSLTAGLDFGSFGDPV